MAVPVDHSYDLAPHPPVPTAARLVLVDNYDSFTWNVYQYLVLEGAAVTVVRNDALTLEELDSLAPTQLVISPGPGHPDIDADVGISKLAIRHFAGRIPILGICMGEQCMYSVFGGTVAGTGAVVHGKTSPLAHDGQGVFEGLPQDIAVTRYHSLAGTQVSLPDCLEVTAWTGNQYGPDSIIMGVRHKTLTVEGVQFHPESILTEGGRLMIRNFLRVRGGTWNQSPAD